MTQTLKSFIGKLDRLQTGSFLDEIRREVAGEGLRLIAKGYRDSVDPYGSRWEPLKSREGKPLVRSGLFRDTWMAYPTPTGVRFSSMVNYGAFHQYGTRTIPFRRVIPMQQYGLPKEWADVVNAAYSKRIRKAVA